MYFLPANDVGLFNVEPIVAKCPKVRLEGFDENISLVVAFAVDKFELDVRSGSAAGLVEALRVCLVIVTVVFAITQLGFSQAFVVRTLKIRSKQKQHLVLINLVVLYFLVFVACAVVTFSLLGQSMLSPLCS